MAACSPFQAVKRLVCLVQALRRQAEFLTQTEGGFAANEFEILQQLGRLSWVRPLQRLIEQQQTASAVNSVGYPQVTEGAKESPLQMSATCSEQVQAVIAFSARYFSGGPFQDPVKVLLKVWRCTVFWRGHRLTGALGAVLMSMRMQEYLPAAKPVGCNELEVASRLSGMPDFKWQAAAAGLSADPPVTPILGAFTTQLFTTGSPRFTGEHKRCDKPIWQVTSLLGRARLAQQ